eukprot:gnl/TRDRNA2_/TRDRNA2_81386_c0_seq1.p1 gnl/TRDRNA2_/TRDRNA2_81386_c0~~gnl/TRDRNA2_/TRDRNA2_81386_c0_seq1.p1  ORF type:complete len:352 (+),score=55.91 gnl/TRDRNA2_/TRDRNA2_81386_c0_seq1:46-1056(+)
MAARARAQAASSRLGPQPSVASVVRKQRAEQEAWGPWARVGVGALAAAVGCTLMLTVFKPPRLEDHKSYSEALKVLQGDGLEPTVENVHFVLQMIDAATKPYSEWGFKSVNANEWIPRCRNSKSARVCRNKPQPALVKSDALGTNMSLVEVESKEARVWLIEDFISDEEAEPLLERIGELNFSMSPTNYQSGQGHRSSSTAFLQREDPLTARVVARAAAVCGVPENFVEPPQVVRYMPGESYLPHLDSEGAEHRHWTLLLYLNDPGAGGATAFPLLKVKVEPSPRAALFWENLRVDPGQGRAIRNYYTLHDGQAPTGNEPKYAMNFWVRNKVYNPL